MLDIRWIRENPQALDAALKKRGAGPESKTLIELDEVRRAAIGKLEEVQTRRNAASKEIGKAKAQKDEATAERLMAEVADLRSTMQALEEEVRKADKTLDDALAIVPNVPLDDVPVGADEHANVEYRKWGKKPDIAGAQEHFEIGEALGGMDFETAAKLSGSRFVVLKGQIARMERALGQFMLDLHTSEHGYTEVQPPLLVKDDAMFGTAQLPKFEDEQYYGLSVRPMTGGEFAHNKSDAAFADFVPIADADHQTDEGIIAALRELDLSSIDPQGWEGVVNYIAQTVELKNGFRKDFQAIVKAISDQFAEIEANRRWLIPTAEVPLTNLVRESILSQDELPIRVAALTPCFRSEAGAAGKDTRGMLRQHQFDKVELVSITTPEQSADEHERMLTCAEEVLKRLDIHYRVLTLSTGDMGFASQKTYDIEVWLPGQGTYREISSCSVCGDFQARRMNARYKSKDSKGNRFVHTLNGSGVAVGRALIAVLENYQNADGSVTVPEALRPYMGGVEKIGP